MNAQHIEQLVVYAAALVCGVVLMGVAPERFPEPIRSFARRLGKYRIAVGLIIAILAIALAVIEPD